MKQVVIALLFSLLAATNARAQLTPTAQGKVTVTTVRNVYSSTNVTTGAWVQLVASLSGSVTELVLFDSSGQTLELGVGASGQETRKMILFPGGSGDIPISFAQGDRVSIRAISATASTGELDINFLR